MYGPGLDKEILWRANKKLEDCADYLENFATSAYCSQGHILEVPAISGLKMFATGIRKILNDPRP